MALTYFKRYRMEVRLDRLPADIDRLSLPEGFELLPWSPTLLQRHAQVKFASFREELDSQVFPCLGELEGCRQLMRDITKRNDFVAEATWLAVRKEPLSEQLSPCGTIQGLRSAPTEGAIQNLGVHPECRDLGLGGMLLRASLLGFRRAGCRYAHLEVTVQNTAAIRLYQRFGFRTVETLYKMADVQYA
jgi:[ribosomal protein S18]-alanine N-acetyltransferase